MRNLLILLLLICSSAVVSQNEKGRSAPVKIAVIGLVHTHVHWILGREDIGDIEIVAIVEPNRALAERYARQHGFSMELVYDSFDQMIEEVEPEAVTAFNTIYDHLEVVRKCAPLGIHVMVEKPLAVSLVHAREMETLAIRHGIHLLTNYETTWYPTTAMVLNQKQRLGTIRKVVVHDGHQGPSKIGVNKEFLEWLIDPELNGAGALTDFGCYGANLITALKDNQRPTSVTAITQQLQPDIYPKVDDEATIILTYPDMQGIIQASWNWSFSRKDWEIYGLQGVITTVDATNYQIKMREDQQAIMKNTTQIPPFYKDPFSYFSAVIRGNHKPTDDLSSLKNNMIVMEILDAAMLSAEEGKTIFLE